MNHTRIVMVAFLLFAFVLPSPARADEIETVRIEKGAAAHHINFHEDPIVVTFGSPIGEYAAPRSPAKWAIKVDLLPGGKALLFRRLVPSRIKQLEGVVEVSTTRGSNVVLTFSGVADKERASSSLIRVVEADEKDERLVRELAARDEQHQKEVAALAERHRHEVAALKEELSRTLQVKEEKALLREVHVAATVRALAQSIDCDTPGIVICGNRWAELQQHGILHFTVVNNSSADFEFSHVQAFRRDTPGNIAGSVRIGGKEPVGPDTVLGRVPARARLPVAVVIRDHERMGNQLRVELSGPDTMTAIRIIELDSPEPRDPPQDFGRITIRLQPTIGAVWLANPVDKEELGAAVLTGLGLRASYAFHTLVVVEAELSGIQSNDASFGDVLFEGATGDVLRSTEGARLLVNGALRIGKKVQPFLRLGVGMQVVDHDVRFVTGQTTSTGPGDGVALDGLFTVGMGLDIHFGEHWTAGAGFSFITLARGTKSAAFSTAVEAGIHIGYGWGGFGRD